MKLEISIEKIEEARVSETVYQHGGYKVRIDDEYNKHVVVRFFETRGGVAKYLLRYANIAL